MPNLNVVPEGEEVESVKEVEEPLEEPIEVIRILPRNIHMKRPNVLKAVKPLYEVDIINIKLENVHHKKDIPIPKLFFKIIFLKISGASGLGRFIWINRGHIHRGSRWSTDIKVLICIHFCRH